jgi:hypothetical protein
MARSPWYARWYRIVLFFFVAFFLIFLIFRLFAAPYSIEFSAFSKAAIATLVVGRIALVLDWTQGSRLAKQRRIVVIACWTFVYALVVVVFLIGGKIFQGVREDLQGGINFEIAKASLDRGLGLVMLITVVVGLYLVMQEISTRWARERCLGCFSSDLLVTPTKY